MVEPFAAGVLSTFFPGCAYLKHTPSVVRTIGASNNKPSLLANFFTLARGAKGKTNLVISNCQVWDSREWACSASRHSIRCSSKIHLVLKCANETTSFLDTAAMRPLRLEEQSQKSRHSSVRRASQSTRDRPRHYLRSLMSEFRANQRRHVSQSSFSTGGEPKILTVDSSLDSSGSLDRFRKWLEPSSLPLGPNFYEMLEKSLGEVEKLLPGLHEIELIELLCSLADKLDQVLYPPYNRDARRIHVWGKRLEDLCRLLPSSPSVHSPHQALITRAQAMMGMLSPSIDYVNSIEKWEDHSFHVGGTVMLAVAFYRSLSHSLHLILRFPILSRKNRVHSYIDNIIHILLSRANVSTVIQMAVQEKWPVLQKNFLFSSLLSSNSDPKRLMFIIRKLQENNIPVPRWKLLEITNSLVAAKDITNAQKLYDSIPPTNHNKYIYTGIDLAARAGDFKQAQTLFDILKARGDVSKQDEGSLLLSYANGGQVREILRVFDEFFPKNDEGKRLNQPNVHHYSTALLAHARNGDCSAVITWLEEMQRSGLLPDCYTFTAVIQAYTKTNDLQGLLDIFSKMQKMGAKPDIATYTVLLGVFANRKDPDSAESLYKLACEEGIIPDLWMTKTLMNAFALSGYLGGATRVFDYLNSHPKKRQCLPLDVYNLIIRTHVVMGAPFSVVSRLFFELKRMYFPNILSYSLLVLSACDAGQLNKATDIYHEMIRASKSIHRIPAYVPTMIMSAFLRQGDRVRAKEIYDEMIKLGIQPDNVTYKEIIRSYRKEGTPESLRVADEFIKRLPEKDGIWDEDDSERTPAIVQLYGDLPSPSTFLFAKERR